MSSHDTYTNQTGANFEPPIDSDEVITSSPENENKLRNRIIKLGVGAAGLAVVLGSVFGITQRGGGEEAPRPQPTAGAGVAPGETIPTPEASAETETSNEVTLDNFEYTFGDKTYVGIDALKRGIGISTEEFSSSDGEAIVKAFFTRVNLINNFEPTADQEAAYPPTYVSEAGHSGTAGMNDDFIVPGMQFALGGIPPEGANTAGFGSPDDWFLKQREHINNIAGNRAVLKEDSDTTEEDAPYRGSYRLDDKSIYIPVALDNQISAVVNVVYTDNGDKNAIGRWRTEDEDGFQGVTTKKLNEPEKVSFTFMKNEEFNTWDLVSVR